MDCFPSLRAFQSMSLLLFFPLPLPFHCQLRMPCLELTMNAQG